MTSKYVAKYPFNGNPAQNQLSFPVGATIIARDGQEGKPWYWGNYMGRDGWFPPTYVAKTSVAAPVVPAAPVVRQTPANAGGGSMQDRMTGVSFTSSMSTQTPRRQQGQQVNPLLSMTNTGINNNTMQSPVNNSMNNGPNIGAGFGVAAATGGFQSGQYDPFADLDTPSSSTTTTTTAASQPTSIPTNFSNTSNVNTSMTSPIKPANYSVSNSQARTITSPSVVTANNSFTLQSNVTNQSPAVPTINIDKSKSTSVLSPGVNPFKSGGGMSLTMSLETRQVNQPSPADKPQSTISYDKISSAFDNMSVSEQDLSSNKEEASTANVLQQDVSQKKLIEEQMARKKEEEEARVKKDKEAAWERQVEMERQKRLQQSKQPSQQIFQTSTSLPSPRAEGIGLSGSNFSGLRASDMGTAEVPLLHPKQGGFFDPFAFISDSKGEPVRKFNPIYRVQPFWSLLNIESYVKRLPQGSEAKTVAEKYDQLTKAMSFMCHIVQENERLCCQKDGMDAPLSFLKANQLGMEACIKMISSLPHSAGASGKQLDQLFLNFINAFVSLINNIQPHQQIVLPGGWQQPDGVSHVCLYIVRNCGGDKFSFTVCNTGDGLEYHPSSFDQSSGLQLKQIAMTIWDIPSDRLMDSSFWVLLFRMQVYPNKRNNAGFLYEKLLPALNSRPLWSNLDLGPAEYLEVPDQRFSNNYHFLAKLALTTIPASGAYPSKYTSLLVMNAAVDLAYRSIESAQPGSMDPEDTRILKLSGRNLASYSSTLESKLVGDNKLGASLSSTWELLDRLLKKINFSSSKPMDQHSHGMSTAALSDSFAKGKVSIMRTEPGSACFPLFGRFRRDNYENVVKELMGDQRPDPILIPAVLTDESMPPVATDFQNAASSLQRVCHACSLLLHQVQLVKNAPAFVASAAQHVLTVTLPMPHLDPKHCFWRKTPMRRETQINLLFLIRRMCRIYSAATTCVQQSRGLIAIRTTAFACAACISDAITRVSAVDDPSPFCLHYSGECEGPTAPFSIEAGSFETLAANMPIFDAHLAALRCLCLDYLRGSSLMMDGTKRPTIFNFDKSMMPMKGDLTLIEQLSIQLALQRPFPPTERSLVSNAATLLSGKNGMLLEVLPELEYFRDIIFYFKHSVSGKAATPTDVAENFTWLPHHATLNWTTKPLSNEDNTSVYNVTAFRGTPQEYVVIEESMTSKSGFKSFMKLFGKGKEVQMKLSAADPTNIVNSCGEKFMKSK